MTNIVILAAGRVKTESNSEVSFPACLTELDGLSVLERIVRNLKKVPDACYTFALHAQDTSDFHLDNIVKLLMPAARITVVPESTSGSACTALLATCELNS